MGKYTQSGVQTRSLASFLRKSFDAERDVPAGAHTTTVFNPTSSPERLRNQEFSQKGPP
jgi:hypothetical protein